jgi:hypothetical protein
MPAVATPTSLGPEEVYRELREKIGNVESLMVSPRAPASDTSVDDRSAVEVVERRRVWYRDIQDAVLDLSKTFPEGVDDFDVRKLLEFVVGLGHLIEDDETAADEKGEIELATMHAADVVRRIQRRLLRQHLDDPGAALGFIFGTLQGVAAGELARLLGTSTKTIGSWKKGGAVRQTAKLHRILLVAQVLTYLRDSLTPHGLILWFEAERDQLDGRTPRQILDDEPGAYELVLDLAKGSRAQLAG